MKILLLILISTISSLTFGQKQTISRLQKIPNVTVFDIRGSKAGLTDLANNKVTFIAFWFIPCGPCFAEMNMLHKLYAKYKANSNLNFMTITFCDSSFVRDLMENRNTDNNDVYEYFKRNAKLDKFNLPVYFIDGYMTKMKRFKIGQSGKGFHGENGPNPTDNTFSPDKVFGFSFYPTIMIFDKKGQLVYSKTGFAGKGEAQEFKDIQNKIESLF